jgi:hypothetical protein
MIGLLWFGVEVEDFATGGPIQVTRKSKDPLGYPIAGPGEALVN